MNNSIVKNRQYGTDDVFAAVDGASLANSLVEVVHDRKQHGLSPGDC
jgi:hypothetical protein